MSAQFLNMQVQINTNNSQAFNNASGGSANNTAEAGVFDSLMSEYAELDASPSSSALSLSSEVSGVEINNFNKNNAEINKNLNSNFAQISQNVLDILALNLNNNLNNNAELLEDLNLNNNNLSELENLFAELENINLNDEDAKILLTDLAEKIINNYADKLSSQDLNKLNALASALKNFNNLNNFKNSVKNININLNNSSSELLDLVSELSEAELQINLAENIKSVLNNLVSRQNNNDLELGAENLNLKLNNYNKVLSGGNNNIIKTVDDDDESKSEGEGGSKSDEDQAKASLNNFNFNNNYMAFNGVARQEAAGSQNFFTQGSQQDSSALISQDYSASQTLTSTSERSSSSSTTASTISSTLLRSQNARSSQSIDETKSGDSKSGINTQKLSSEDAEFQKVLNSTETGTESNDKNNGEAGSEDNNKNLNNLNSLNKNNKNINKNNLVQGDRDLNIINNNRPERVHNDFASFFDGALYNRRTFARVEAAPLNLNLNNNYNYSRAETLREGIVNVIRFTRADGLHKANMIIDPPAIGRVTVELTSSTSGVEASIKVVNEQVRQLVQDQITELRMTLEQQGVQVTQFAVDVQQDNAGRQQEQQEQSGQGRRRVNALGGLEPDAESEAEEFRIDLNEGLLYWVA